MIRKRIYATASVAALVALGGLAFPSPAFATDSPYLGGVNTIGNRPIDPPNVDSPIPEDHARSLESLLAAAEADGVNLEAISGRGALGSYPIEYGTVSRFFADGRVVMEDTVAHQWLTANAADYGFTQPLPRESWYWAYSAA